MAPSPPAPKSRRRTSFALPAFGVLVLIVIIAGRSLYVGVEHGLSATAIEETIQSWGMWGVAASIGLMVIHSFVPFPAEFVAFANGMLYGTLFGIVITWTGAMLGAVTAFALARALGWPFVRVMVARHHWDMIDDWTARRGGYVVLLARLVPVIAFNLINYAADLTRLSWWTFIWTIAVGILPVTAIMVAMGAHLDALSWPIWALVGAAAICLWFVLRRKLISPLRASERDGQSTASAAE